MKHLKSPRNKFIVKWCAINKLKVINLYIKVMKSLSKLLGNSEWVNPSPCDWELRRRDVVCWWRRCCVKNIKNIMVFLFFHPSILTLYTTANFKKMWSDCQIIQTGKNAWRINKYKKLGQIGNYIIRMARFCW